MKHVIRIFLVMVLVAGIIGCATAEKKPDLPGTLEVLTPVLDLSNKETDVKLKGTGFTPGQEIMVLITDVDGIRTDVGWALDPEPKADASGAWETTWDASRFVSKKLITAGDYSITVTDADYNEIDTQPIKITGKLPKKKKK
jgi:hypothetical protein